MASRKRTVSGSITITSTKLAVIQIMSYFSRDSRSSTTISASDSAAATAGRRSKASQKKLSRPQVSRKNTLGTTATSVHAISASAMRWSAATSRMCRKSRRATAPIAVRRLIRNDREGGMAGAPVPGNDHLFGVRHTDRLSYDCINFVISRSQRRARAGWRLNIVNSVLGDAAQPARR